MVSRRKILSRSRDDLNLDSDNLQDSDPNGDLNPYTYRNNRRINLMDPEDDVWYHKDKLYKDHIQEVLDKWESIDDEIWAKVIVLERNRRVAKAYARAPVLTINGNNDGFDGFRIGMNGFDNPMRDQKTLDIKALIGQGCKVKMDGTGNILVKRLARSPVYVKNTIYEENAVSNDILKLPNSGLLEPIDKPFKLFDMKKFQQNVNREMKRPFPDRKKLEVQCVSAIAFVKNEAELLDSPIWIMLINVVALEMLKAKMPATEEGSNVASQPHTKQANGRGPNHVRNSSEPRKRFLASGSSDEDPYSLTPSGSSGSSGKGKGDSAVSGGPSNSDHREGRNRKAVDISGSNGDSGHGSGSNGERSGVPRLPQKEKDYYGPQNWAKVNNHARDYSDDMEDREIENFKTLQKKKDRYNSNGNGARGNGITSSDGVSPRNRIQQLMESANGVPPIRARYRNSRKNEAKNDSDNGKRGINSDKQDDPYYCGMRARVPNFVSNGPSNGFNNNGNKKSAMAGAKENNYQMNGGVKGKLARNSQQNGPPSSMSNSNSAPNLAQLPGAAHPFWWHSRLYPDSGASTSPMSNGHNGFPMATPIAFRTSAADLSNYHYPGRNRGYHLGGGPVSSPITGGVTTGGHRPQVFRTGWE